jgi:hypothetical protein
MDHQSLQRLANTGIRSFPPDKLNDIVEWCWDYGETTGDARYCSTARALSMLAELFDNDEGGVDATLVEELDTVLCQHIPGILAADSAEHGAQLARHLREILARTIQDF